MDEKITMEHVDNNTIIPKRKKTKKQKVFLSIIILCLFCQIAFLIPFCIYGYLALGILSVVFFVLTVTLLSIYTHYYPGMSKSDWFRFGYIPPMNHK